jgi:hypothetical protein
MVETRASPLWMVCSRGKADNMPKNQICSTPFRDYKDTQKDSTFYCLVVEGDCGMDLPRYCGAPVITHVLCALHCAKHLLHIVFSRCPRESCCCYFHFEAEEIG